MNFPADICTQKSWVLVIPYAAIPLIVALFPGYSDITRFLPWSTIATGNHMKQAKKIPNLRRRLASLTFMFRFQPFRDPQSGELPHIQIIMTDRSNYLT
jgi:hypothetical protein